jgi:hypothetical protein
VQGSAHRRRSRNSCQMQEPGASMAVASDRDSEAKALDCPRTIVCVTRAAPSATPVFAGRLVREAYDRRDCTVAEIAADFGVTRQTVYRALKKTETGAAPRV